MRSTDVDLYFGKQFLLCVFGIGLCSKLMDKKLNFDV